MPFTIYKITNTINNKTYIGSTKVGIEKRWKTHIASHNLKQYAHLPLYLDFRQYGIDSFYIGIIEECESRSIMIARELYWIKELNSGIPNGYNTVFNKPPFPAKEAIRHDIIDGINDALDGRKRRWLSDKTDILGPRISNLLNGYKQFSKDELDKINKVLGTDFKL